jgi:hypothetical protein
VHGNRERHDHADDATTPNTMSPVPAPLFMTPDDVSQIGDAPSAKADNQARSLLR